MLQIYHNPACSKSRKALEIVQAFAQQHQLVFAVIEYLKTPPDAASIRVLQAKLGAAAMVRDGDDVYQQLQLADADAEGLLHALLTHPKLLQRPIIVFGDHAKIARPSEGLADWLLAIHQSKV